MKLAYIDLCGFRGYRNRIRIDFAAGFTIVDGRNGVGKSTLFDGIEFALTGTIAKYGDAKAAGETVADYIWWNGEGPPPQQRYVEVGFRAESGDVIPIRRTELADQDPKALSDVVGMLCDTVSMPKSGLSQLCAASIIRDEHIAALSLDLKETERYELLCNAIGATDSERWIQRGAAVLSLAKKRVHAAEREAEAAAKEVSTAARRIDEIRARFVEEALVAQAVARLQSFTRTQVAPDQLLEFVRKAIADRGGELDRLIALERSWSTVNAERERLDGLRHAISAARDAKASAEMELGRLSTELAPPASSNSLARTAKDLATLAALGRELGLHDGHCPLCASELTPDNFAYGVAAAERLAREYDEQAVSAAAHERRRKEAEAARIAAQSELEGAERELQRSTDLIAQFERDLVPAGLTKGASITDIRGRAEELRSALDTAREDFRIAETVKLSGELERAGRAEAEAGQVYARAEERLGVLRRAESRAQVLNDAVRRAAGETLDRRLERVLPLMVELYRRLRPHPVWEDIDYSIRGDLRRFLRLQVGDELNPQFMFSSGQRRATGLAFLISVNLALAWSRWRTILLDDPVQHVDDFRSVNLVEVIAQLSAAGRQIICAVEDAALADLLSRRLPVERSGHAKRVTLGMDSDGALAKLCDEELQPFVQQALVPGPRTLAG